MGRRDYKTDYTKPTRMSYRGPGGRDAGKPPTWERFLNMLANNKPSDIEAWWDTLPENERGDIRHGVRQAVSLMGAIARLNIPDLVRIQDGQSIGREE